MAARNVETLGQNPAFGEIIDRIAGDRGAEITNILLEKEATDEELAKKIGIRLNLVRKILYDLYDNRVVSYRRVRDEKTGWYVYFWKIDYDRAMELLGNNKRVLIDKLRDRIEYERSTMFFTCGSSCPKLSFEDAAEFDFKCPRCKKKLTAFDNTNLIAALEEQMESLNKDYAGG